jgi:hypothetical protein
MTVYLYVKLIETHAARQFPVIFAADVMATKVELWIQGTVFTY